MRLKIAVLFAVMISSVSFSQKSGETVEEFVSKMSIEDKIGQMMMTGISGNDAANNNSYNIIKKYRLGGIILFGYNIGDAAKLKRFTSAMQKNSSDLTGIPLFISTDQESGLVVRIKDGVTQFPGTIASGSADDPALTKKAAYHLGMQMKSLGLNMNLAPVADINNNPDNPVINVRSFGSDPAKVSAQVKAYVEGLQSAGCAAVVKHFPGHGNTSKDSHKVLPEINSTMEEIENFELKPFRAAIDSDVSSFMTAHISYPKILSSSEPATFSEYFLKKILRDKMKYKGLIFTDDLEMGALSQHLTIGQSAVKAVKAGVDILLTTSSRADQIFYALCNSVKKGEIPESRIDESVIRIIRTKRKFCTMNSDDYIFPNTEADEVNRLISEKALYLFGNNTFTEIKDDKIIIVSDNAYFNSLFPVQNFTAMTSSQFFSSNTSGRKIYIYSHSVNKALLDRIIQLSSKNFVTFVYSGNPFLFSKFKQHPATLFMFSNTNASFAAAANYIKGQITAKTVCPVNFGF